MLTLSLHNWSISECPRFIFFRHHLCKANYYVSDKARL